MDVIGKVGFKRAGKINNRRKVNYNRHNDTYIETIIYLWYHSVYRLGNKSWREQIFIYQTCQLL